MIDSLLSQQEIEALLGKVSNDDLAANTRMQTTAEVTRFDYSKLNHIVRGKMPAIDTINERFAKEFHASLFQLLGRDCDVSIIGTKVENYSDFLQHLLHPASLNIVKVEPPGGTAIVIFDSNLVFNLVDCYCGGSGATSGNSGSKKLSPFAMRITRIFLQAGLEKMARAWSVVKPLTFEYLHSEANPRFVDIARPWETVMSSVFHIELGNVGGDLIFTMPTSILDPAGQQLLAGMYSDKSKVNAHWVTALHNEIFSTKILLTAVLTEFKLVLGEVNSWQPGNIIAVAKPENILLRSDFVPVCHGTPDSSNGHYAVRIDSFVQSETGAGNSAVPHDRSGA